MMIFLPLVFVLAADLPGEKPASAAGSPAQASVPEPAAKAAPQVAPEAAPEVDVKLSAEESREADATLHFADHLFLDGDYYRAISEYRRYLFATKGRGDEAPRAAMAIGEALLRGEQLDAAGRQLDGVATRTLDLKLRREALFGSGLAYLEDNRPEMAKPRFRLIVEDKDTDPATALHARWLLAWGHFDAGELDKAREVFSVLAAQGVFAQEAAGVVAALDAKTKLELKDPLVAALLSIIPGAGHLYLGQWATGVTSLAWNALFIAAAVSAWISGDWGVAIVLTFLELGWYSGSMFGAVAGAYRHNRDVIRNWRDEVVMKYGTRRELPELNAVDRAPPGTFIRFQGTF